MNQMIMIVAVLWDLMTTISKSFLLLIILFLSNYTFSNEYRFTIVGTDIAITDMQANAETLLFIRNNAWKSFNIDPAEIDDNKFYDTCWKDLISNKEIKYKITNTILSTEKIRSESVDYKFTYDFKNIKFLNPIKNLFIDYCYSDNEAINQMEYKTSTDSFDIDDI
mgnify:FL=1